MRETDEKLRRKMAGRFVGGSYPQYLPDVGDYIVITNNTVSHDIPIGTIFKVEGMADSMSGGGCDIVVDKKVSPKLKGLPEGTDLWVHYSDYAVLHNYSGEQPREGE